MLIIVTTCLSLGIWQLYRLNSKQKLIDDITLKEKLLLPTDLDEISNFTNKDFIYVWFKVRGKFLPHKHILLYGRYKDKYIVISPLLTNKGKILMVAQGLISHKQAPIFLQRSSNQHSQDVEITGIAMEFEQPNKFTPQNNLQSNIWFCLKQEDIKNYLGKYDTSKIINFYVLQKSATPSNPELTPLQTNILAKIQNHHLEYAITWISLAIIAVLVYRYRFYS